MNAVFFSKIVKKSIYNSKKLENYYKIVRKVKLILLFFDCVDLGI